MANKDLIRRALSVTANLPTPRVEGPLPATQEAAQHDGSPLPIPAATVQSRTGAVQPKTGPGSMLAFMTDQSQVHQEVVRLREQVSAFEGAMVARKIDPARITPSKWANRDEGHFATDAFARLKQEIANAEGNVQPIKVRPSLLKNGEEPSWEIVFGHRRHRACLELGLPVLAVVQEDMKDAELFIEMERENREREDLSAWEQGVMYMRALEMGLFPSAKQMAAAIERDMGNISRAMALAKLPSDVISAFGSPLNLQFRWASPLKEAHQRDPERLIALARELAQLESKKSPAETFAILTQGPEHPSAHHGAEAEWKDDSGKRLAALTTDRRGRAVLSFDKAMDATQRKKLVRLVDAFLGIKN